MEDMKFLIKEEEVVKSKWSGGEQRGSEGDI